MDDATTVTLRGAGGCLIVFDLPLKENYADQVRKRELVPADEESADRLAALTSGGETPAGQPSEPEPDSVPDGSDANQSDPASDSGESGDENEPPREGDGANIDAWRSYAVDELGLDVPDGATVDDIVAIVDALDDTE